MMHGVVTAIGDGVIVKHVFPSCTVSILTCSICSMFLFIRRSFGVVYSAFGDTRTVFCINRVLYQVGCTWGLEIIIYSRK